MQKEPNITRRIKMEKVKQKENAITLIALVITIIVLLILAGVTITALNGDNGILTKASESKQKTEETQEFEQVKMSVLSSQIAETNALEIEKENLEKALKEQFGNDKEILINDNKDGSFLIYINDTKRKYYIDDTGNVIENSKILEISTVEDLKIFRNNVNNGNTYEGWYIYLTNDITLNEKWEAIGKYDNSSSNPEEEINKRFSGIFNGNWNCISGLNINSTEKGKGLFALVKKGEIKNLGIKDSTITGSSAIGGIIGYAYDNTIIENCFSEATITANDRYIGGIVGYANKGINIEKCYNNGNITGAYNIGGICGSMVNSNISSCYNTGNLTGNSDDASVIGGICSEISTNNNDTGSKIQNCYNIGRISSKNSNILGAIVGKTKSTKYTISNNYFLENMINGNNGTIFDGTIKKTSEEMKNIENNLENDFEKDTENINDGYPILQWQEFLE